MPDWEVWVSRQLDLPVMTDRRDQRIVGELAAHLEEVWREARARGATAAEAEALVLAKLGERREAAQELLSAERRHAAAEAARQLERAEEGLRERSGGWRSLADLLWESRLTLRALANRPLFTGLVVFVLALGIGATTVIFTLLDAIVLSPLPFRDADRLVSLGHAASSTGGGEVGQCAAWHFTYLDENRVFEDLGMYSLGGTIAVIGEGDPEAVSVLGATSGIFSALGMSAVLGRVIRPADEDPDAPAVVLLGHGYWRSRFGGDSTIVGRTLRTDGGEMEVVGVLPPSLAALGEDPGLVVPLRFRRADLFVGDIGFLGVARLRDGVTRREALADMTRMLPLAFEKFPGGPVIEAARQADYVPNVRPLRDALVGVVENPLWIVMAGVALVLLIACANVANLVLVRAGGKDREMAVRAAMGASRGRIAWEHLKESLLLGALGCLAGIGFACGGLRALVAMAPVRLPRIEEVSLDPKALLFATAVSLGAALFFGAFPVTRFWRRDLAVSLKQGGQVGAHGRKRHLAQQVLAASQIAFALVLLVASGLVFRSTRALHRVDPGFSHADDVLALRLGISERIVAADSEAAQMQEAIARRLGEIAGVRSVGMATGLPMHPGGNINPLYVEGITVARERPPITRRHKWVGGGYFETLGIPLLAGRGLTWGDARERAPVVVVSRSLALTYWGSVEAAMGKRVSARPDPIRWHEVVGVVGDVREDGLSLDPVPMVYWPQVTLAFWQGSPANQVQLWLTVSYAIRSDRVGTPDFLDDVRRGVWSVNPNLPLVDVGRLSGFVSQSMVRTTFTLALLAIAGIVALILGLVGVYGVVSYSVSQRAIEIGMRMALGANAEQIRTMVLRQGFFLAAVGAAVGLGLSLAVTRVMAGFLFGVSPTDPLTFVAVPLGVAAAVLLASYLPAHRASRVAPMAVLRGD